MKLTTLMAATTLCLAVGAFSYAQDSFDPAAPNNGAPTRPEHGGGGKHKFKKKIRRAFRAGVCVGEQLGKAGETLAKPVANETPAQKQAREQANFALIKAAAQAGDCIKKKPAPTPAPTPTPGA